MLWIDTQTDQDAERVNSAMCDWQLSIFAAEYYGRKHYPGEGDTNPARLDVRGQILTSSRR